MNIKTIRDQLVYLKDTNPWLLLLWNEHLRRHGMKNLKRYSDIEAINKLFYDYAGRYPNLDDPQTFSEKMQWLKLHYRNEAMIICADKYKVRKYLEDKGCSDLLNELLAVYESVDEIDLNVLPDQFILKATHGSGWNLGCKEKKNINWTVYRKIINSWLHHNIFWNGREWHYNAIKPRIVCEKYLQDASGNLIDYKFFCFNGQPTFIQANKGRGTKNHAQNFFNLNWQIQPFGKDLVPRPEIEISCPVSLENMIAIAKKLSKDFPFVRVDFYEVEGKSVFGELTFFPASGMPDFVPSYYDKIVGDMLVLPDKNY